MLLRVCVSAVMATSLSVWCQVVPTATGEAPSQADSPMQTPPPVTGEPYPTETGSEARSNYLRGGLIISSAYSDNVLPSDNTRAISDMTYSLSPSVALDISRPRLHQTFTYAPVLSIYQHTSALNAVDQAASATCSYRLSQHAAVSLRDHFNKSSNVFSGPYSLSGGPITGSPQTPVGVVAPWAPYFVNTATGEVSYQYSRNLMVGAGGATTRLTYTDKARVQGVGDSSSRDGSGFYNVRLTETQYIGAMYQYSASQSSSEALQSNIQTHTLYFFYSFYPTRGFSLSVTSGPQHYQTAMHPSPDFHGWAPALTASMNWQAGRATADARYSHMITGGGGLAGLFRSDEATVSARWQATRHWTMGANARSWFMKNVGPTSYSSSSGGRTVSGNISIGRAISEHIAAEFAYEKWHQRYDGVARTLLAPDVNRESVSISYRFDRPLGR